MNTLSVQSRRVFEIIAVVAVIVAALHPCQVIAAPFVNLDFEQATIVHVDPNFPPAIDAAAAFPGWTARLGTHVATVVAHDYSGIGEGLVSLYDRPHSDFLIPLLQGQYMALLIRDSSGPDAASLEQVGDIPQSTRSLQVLADGGRTPPTVTLNGTVIPMSYISGIPFAGNRVRYGADISAYAGTTAALRFTSRGIEAVDDVIFSSDPIPEPHWTAAVLAGCLWPVRRSIRTGQTRIRRKHGKHNREVGECAARNPRTAMHVVIAK